MFTHVAFTVATGVQVHFCAPVHPRQRESDENTNGLLRQHVPRSVAFSSLHEKDVDAIADALNGGHERRSVGARQLRSSPSSLQ